MKERILWNKSLRAFIIHSFVKSFIGLKCELNKSSLFLINIYMPCSTYHNIDKYVEKVSKLASFCKERNNSNICLLGDFNAGPENIFFYFNLYIYPPDSQESDGVAIHRVSNYPDLLPEMPRYCCPLVS